ncbi:hypothetical protein GCM10023333_10250 [Ferrimonas pelagia]|uniref:Uncharacterized protein n=1 Tax=Ferrimonas pelagia TaxID=1177826 RepID=A0ABP9EQM8_9GAMM
MDLPGTSVESTVYPICWLGWRAAIATEKQTIKKATGCPVAYWVPMDTPFYLLTKSSVLAQ